MSLHPLYPAHVKPVYKVLRWAIPSSAFCVLAAPTVQQPQAHLKGE